MATVIKFRGLEYTLRHGENVLDGLLRHGCEVNYSCRAGSCHSCMLRADRGRVPASATRGISPELRALGYFLPCRCIPDDPISMAEPDPAHLRIPALVADKQIIGPDLCRLLLEPAREVNPNPGQYVTLVDDQGCTRPYSIAGLPDEDYYLEINVRRVVGGVLSEWLYDEVEVGDELGIQPPAGNLVNDDPPAGQHILLLATGTGLAPMLALSRAALRRDDSGSVTLFHGGARVSDLYADEQLRSIAEKNRRFSYFGCVSRDPVRSPWLHGRVTNHFPDIIAGSGPFDVFIAGHPEMVAEAEELCIRNGITTPDRIKTDMFSYAHKRDEQRPALRDRKVPPPDPELWAALHGGELLTKVLKDFYSIVFKDERLGPYFADVTQQRLVEKQYSFMKSLITGSRDYLGQRPPNAHHWMVISDDLFDYRLSILRKCMERHKIAQEWIHRWHEYEEYFRGDIVKSRGRPRIVDGVAIELEGFEETELGEATLCDACQAEIASGCTVRYQRRLGKVYCSTCARLKPEIDIAPLAHG